jgi:hypothetical protein
MRIRGSVLELNELRLTAISPTGADPPTEWICVLELTAAECSDCQARIEKYGFPVTLHIVGPQEHGDSSKRRPNRDKWLAATNRKLIASRRWP